MENNNISTHEFKGGSIIAIGHSDEVQIAMESAKLSQDLSENVRLTEAGTIKGVLTLSGVRALEVNGKKSKARLEMLADDATILEFDIEGSRIHFFVEWGNLPRSPGEKYTDIVIEADRWSWEESPGSFDPNGILIIEKRFLVPLIILAAPTMKEALADPLQLGYIALAELARHVVDLYKLGDLSGFPEIFNLIERLHVDGDDYVREAATIGFLEDLQNIAGHESEITPEVFVPFLGPESKRWWDALNDFWSGKKSTVRL